MSHRAKLTLCAKMTKYIEDCYSLRTFCENVYATLKVNWLLGPPVAFPGSPRARTKNASDGKLGGAWKRGYREISMVQIFT